MIFIFITVGKYQTVNGFRGRGGGVCKVAIGRWYAGQHSEQSECSFRLPVTKFSLLHREHRENNLHTKVHVTCDLMFTAKGT